MFSTESALFFLGLLVLAVLLQPLALRCRLPFAVVLVMLGFAGSELITRDYGIDTGVRWDNVKPLVFNIFIPIIIFAAAIHIDPKAWWRHGLWIALLALPFTVLGVLLIAAVLYFGIGHQASFPWEAALLCAVLISATDPSILPTAFKQAASTRRANILLDGESLFNDALAVVMFSVLLALLSHQLVEIDYVISLDTFLLVFLGGILSGLAAGGVLLLLLRIVTDVYLQTLLTLLICYGVYIIAGQKLGVSGVMAVLTAGLMLGHFASDTINKATFISRFWEFAERITYIIVFLLAGITITVSMFTERWLAMVIGVVAVLGARAALLLLLPLLTTVWGRDERFSLFECALLTWGGVRGTVTLALALSLPIHIPAWYTMQSIAYGVVLFNLFVQVTTMPLLIKHRH